MAATAPAHVKWFAPYIVSTAPQQLGQTLANQWFWTGITLVLVFLLATRAVEKLPPSLASVNAFLPWCPL